MWHHLIFKKQISIIIPFLFLISMCDATDNSITLKKASEGKYKIGTALNRSQIAGKDTNSVKLAVE